MRNETRIEIDEYLTDELSNEAVDFIERNSTKKFFLYLSYNAPHTPMQASAKYLNRFDHIEDPLRKTYAAMVSAVDDGVGRVLDKLDELQLSENTLVFFLSDNGGANNNGSINTPLRDRKGSVYEGGMRVPFAFRWTGKVPSGVDYDYPISSMDILATMVKLTGVDIAPDRPLDGVDLLPFVTGEKKGRPHESLFWLKWDAQEGAVRVGDQKLVLMEEEKSRAMYQLSEDIGERNDVAGSHSEDVGRMNTAFDAWKAQLIEPAFDPLGTWRP